MKSALSPVNHDHTRDKRLALVILLAFFLMPVAGKGRTPQAQKVLTYLKGLGRGRLRTHPLVRTRRKFP